MGSGTLEIDVLERTFRFEGEEIERLTIADELHGWMAGDLVAHDMTASDLREASIRARLILKRIREEDRQTTGIYSIPGKQRLGQQDYIVCDIWCNSRVATNEKVYVSDYHDLEEWPLGWHTDGGHNDATSRRPAL